MTDQGILLVLSGPSGVGKTTIARRLTRRPGFTRITTCTTRPRRKGEADGRDYHFLSREEFEGRVGSGGFLEHAEVHGERYGTPRAAVEEALRQGRVVVLAVDVHGARAVREGGLPALFLFLEAPDDAELDRRIRDRGTEREEEVKRRLKAADRERGHKDWFDGVVVNDEVDRAVGEILGLLRKRGREV